MGLSEDVLKELRGSADLVYAIGFEVLRLAFECCSY